MSVVTANPEHEVTYLELAALVGRHAATLSAEEILAITANMLGKLIAMQDQKTMTAQRAMAIVTANLELGNQQVFDMLHPTKGSA